MVCNMENYLEKEDKMTLQQVVCLTKEFNVYVRLQYIFVNCQFML